MIELINNKNIHHYQDEMEQAYKLRHKVFVEEKGWNDLYKEDLREIDQFDNEHAIHMICKQDDRVVGYQRMLPTIRPHLLTEVLPELCETVNPTGPHIWEWTRYAVEKPYRKGGKKLSPVANQLLSAIIEWGLANDINQIIIEMDTIWLLRLVQLNFLVTPLGIPKTIDGSSTVAVIAKFDHRTLQILQDLRGDYDRVLAQSYPMKPHKSIEPVSQYSDK